MSTSKSMGELEKDMKALMATEKGGFFEGVEKRLEVWFTTQSGNAGICDLRKIPRYVCGSC